MTWLQSVPLKNFARNVTVLAGVQDDQTLTATPDGSLVTLPEEASETPPHNTEHVKEVITATLDALPELPVSGAEVGKLVRHLSKLPSDVFDRDAITPAIERVMWPELGVKETRKVQEKERLRHLENVAAQKKAALAAAVSSGPVQADRLCELTDREFLWKMRQRAKDAPELTAQVEDFAAAVAERVPCRNTYEALRAAWRIEQVKFAQSLGVDLKPLHSGTSGTYLGLDRHRKPLLLFKPKDEEAFTGHGPARWVHFMLKARQIALAVCPAVRNPDVALIPGRGYLAETAASAVSRFLGLDLVPYTSVEKFASDTFLDDHNVEKEGSCQMFKSRARTGGAVLGMPHGLRRMLHRLTFSRKDFLKRVDTKEFHRLLLLMWITGELDGHEENWMVKKTKDGRQKLIKIDNGMSFYNKHPVRPLEGVYQHEWSWLPQASMAFGDDAKAVMSQLDSEEKFSALAAAVAEAMTVDGVCWFDDEQRQMLQDRVEVLKQYVMEGKTPAELAQIRTQEDFDRVLKRPGASVTAAPATTLQS